MPIDYENRPEVATKRVWEIVHRLYDAREAMDNEETSVSHCEQDSEAGKWAWMKMAAEIVAVCAECGGNGIGPDRMNGNEVENHPCPECGGSGLTL